MRELLSFLRFQSSSDTISFVYCESLFVFYFADSANSKAKLSHFFVSFECLCTNILDYTRFKEVVFSVLPVSGALIAHNPQPILIESAPNQSLPTSLNTKVLVLNQSYEPISVCNAKKAFLLIYMMKAEIVAERSNRSLRSVNSSFPYPSVIRLSSFIRVPFKKIELSRKNVLRRDNFRCQYCSSTTNPLTIDHIIPKSRGGTEVWENLVAACLKCNNKKGNRTPEEAQMRLLSTPRRPHHVIFLKQYMSSADETWRPYLFME
jgi:5-methylcytosine-specific restriction endonuclease McrA